MCSVFYNRYLQEYYLKEIMRGFTRIGMFKLKLKYAHLKIDLTEIGNTVVMNYENIVKSIKEEEFLCPLEPLEGVQSGTNPTLKMKALEFIQKDKVFLNPKGRFFTIQSGDNFYTVTLSPKPKCTCPATNLCPHLIAASISIGMEANDDLFNIFFYISILLL